MGPLCFHVGQKTEGLVFHEKLNKNSAKKLVLILIKCIFSEVICSFKKKTKQCLNYFDTFSLYILQWNTEDGVHGKNSHHGMQAQG